MENKKTIEIVRQNLIDLRKQSKLTQVELADKIGYSAKTVSRWETGDVIPDIDTLEVLSNIYNISIKDLFDANLLLRIKPKNFKERQMCLRLHK